MVQNQNWQRRVESADARRKESKQKKMISEQKRAYKNMIQDMYHWLNQNNDSILNQQQQYQDEETKTTASCASVWELHVWTDTVPIETIPFLNIFLRVTQDQCHTNNNGGGGNGTSGRTKRDRSASLGDLDAVPVSHIMMNGGASSSKHDSGRRQRERSGSFQLSQPSSSSIPPSSKGRNRSGSLQLDMVGGNPSSSSSSSYPVPNSPKGRNRSGSLQLDMIGTNPVPNSPKGRKGRKRSGSLQIEIGAGSTDAGRTKTSSSSSGRKGRNRSGSFPQEASSSTLKKKGILWSGSIGEKPEDDTSSPSKKYPQKQSQQQQYNNDHHHSHHLQLCSTQFFNGHCPNRSWTNNNHQKYCHCVHYNNIQFKTLSEVAKQQQQQQQQQDWIMKAKTAAAIMSQRGGGNDGVLLPGGGGGESSSSSSSSSMEMLYYLGIPISSSNGEEEKKEQEKSDDSLLSTSSTKNNNGNHNNDEGTTPEAAAVDESSSSSPPSSPPTKLTDSLSQRLSSNNCSSTSIVYIALSTPTQTVLLYDRNQNGRIVSDFKNHILLAGRRESSSSSTNNSSNNNNNKNVQHPTTISRTESSLSNNESDDHRLLRSSTKATTTTTTAATWNKNLAEHIPVSVLEHILEYASAPAVAIAAQVCTTWYREIQHASPNLWKHLLNQRSWPLPISLISTFPHTSTTTATTTSTSTDRSPNAGGTAAAVATTTSTTAAYYRRSSSMESNGTTITTETSTSSLQLQDKETSHTVANLLKEEFIQHYSVRRELLAIQQALTGLLPRRGGGGGSRSGGGGGGSSSRNKNANPSPLMDEMTVHSFATRRGAPQPPGHCVAVEVWSPNHVLAAYSHDCTLRLFQTITKGGGGMDEKSSCRQVVCQRIDPYKHTRKKTCFLEAMGLDEEVVGCLCRIADETTLGDTNKIRQRYNLIVLHRDDVLVADSRCEDGITEPEEGALSVIDVEMAVLNYVLTLDHVDHRLLRLHDFLTGGDMEDVELLVSPTMATCGSGRFMVEVAISIPILDDGHDDEEESHHSESGRTMELIDRKLFLFSSTEGAIVWMGESHSPNEALRPRLEDISLVSLRATSASTSNATTTTNTSGRTSCSVAAVSLRGTPTVTTFEMGSSGHLQGRHIFEDWTLDERHNIAPDVGWTESRRFSRSVVVSPTDVVVGGTLVTEEGNDDFQYKAIITFYSRLASTSSSNEQQEQPMNGNSSKLLIGENCAIESMISYRENYTVVLCRFLSEIDDGTPRGPFNMLSRVGTTKVYAIIIHIPSRQEVDRMCLYEDYDCDTFSKLCLSVTGNTVACGVWWKGLIMTGSDVRSIGGGDYGTRTRDATTGSLLSTNNDNVASPSSKSPKKKNGKRRQSGKKDRFVRGLSLRG